MLEAIVLLLEIIFKLLEKERADPGFKAESDAVFVAMTMAKTDEEKANAARALSALLSR